jgi:hypothetical protein
VPFTVLATFDVGSLDVDLFNVQTRVAANSINPFTRKTILDTSWAFIDGFTKLPTTIAADVVPLLSVHVYLLLVFYCHFL